MVLLLTVTLPALPSGVHASAADPTEVAAREVAAMKAEVARTASALTDGTQRLERQRTDLGSAQRRLDRARRDAAAAGAASDAARAQLQSLLAAAYRSPLPDGVLLAFSGGPDAFRAAVVAQADLERVRGTQTDLLRQATGERVKARTALRTVDQLTGETARRAREIDAQVAALQRTADDAALRLTTASGRLASARARAASVSATCTGSRTGSANGFLDRGALCPLDGAPGAALRADAAAAFNRMTAAAQGSRGARLCVTDSYRSYAGQVSVFRRKPALAAVPGTSRHGLGVALDLGCGAQRFGSPAYRWLKANAGRFGWVHPSWAEPGGALPEPWHWEYTG